MNTNSLALFKAINYAAEKHKLQFRKGTGESYITHPIGVADILIEAGVNDIDCIIGAILHDTVEDTDATFTDIGINFGSKVELYVRDVSDDKSLPKLKRKLLQIEHAKTASIGGQLIKLADKLHNLSDLLSVPPTGWTEKDIRGYFLWSREVVSGIWDINENLKEQLQNIFDNSKFSNGEYIVPKCSLNAFKELGEYYRSL